MFHFIKCTMLNQRCEPTNTNASSCQGKTVVSVNYQFAKTVVNASVTQSKARKNYY